jgi:hypothetical protein
MLILAGLLCLSMNSLIVPLIILGLSTKSTPYECSLAVHKYKDGERKWQNHKEKHGTSNLYSTKIVWRTSKLWDGWLANAVYDKFRRYLSNMTGGMSDWYNGGFMEPVHQYVEVHYKYSLLSIKKIT